MKTINQLRVFTSNGIEYITAPEAVKFTKISREALNQRIVRKLIPDLIRENRYIFIPLEYCKNIKLRQDKQSIIQNIKNLSDSDLKQIQKFIESNEFKTSDSE